MRLGALLGPIADAGAPGALAEQARRYVGSGLQSLWSAQAIGRGFMFSDPFVALSVAASVTEVVEIGTAVIQVPLYHPVDLAHRVFSLQQICGDRLLLGVGAGSTERDFAALGRNYPDRFKQFTAGVADLRTLFADGRMGGWARSICRRGAWLRVARRWFWDRGETVWSAPRPRSMAGSRLQTIAPQ